jgi:undecaprenyl-diphosphatase
MPIEQIVLLAVIQGITEFLPISSSGHLILVPVLTGWADQGLVVDVMVHMGSLAAVFAYFWRDVLGLACGGLNLLRGRVTPQGKMAIYILLATIPAVLFGLFLRKSGLGDALRLAEVVAWNAIIWGIALYVADRLGPMKYVMEDMKLPKALIIGVAQALALIPGTSRSGITMTAGRMLGFTRPESARFSFLLGIPAILGAGILVIGDAVEAGEPITLDAILTGGLTFFTALAAIAVLMAMVKRMSFLPFTIYRVILGVGLLAVIYSGFGFMLGTPG